MSKAGTLSINVDLGTAQLLVDLDKTSAKFDDFGKRATASGHAGVTAIQSIGGELRVLEGSGGIRAAERFLAGIPGLAKVAQASFAAFGAVAVGEVLVRIGQKIGELYQKWDPVQQANKRATDELKEYDSKLGGIRDKLASIGAASNVLAFGKSAGAALNANTDAAGKVQRDQAQIGILRQQISDAQGVVDASPVGHMSGLKSEIARAAQKDIDTYKRQMQELQAQLEIDQAAQSKLVSQSITDQMEQNSSFTGARIENELAASAAISNIGRKTAEVSISLNETVQRAKIDGYTSAQARAVAGASLEVQVAQQRADRIGAIDASETQRRVQLLTQKAAAIPSSSDDTHAGRERIAIEGQIAAARAAGDEKQLELKAAVAQAQAKYQAAEATATREFTAMVVEQFDVLDRGWKEAEQRVKEYEEVRAKAQIKASETEAAGAGEAAGIRVLGEKLALERAYGLEVAHTGAQQVAYLSQIAVLEQQSRSQNITGKRNELATAEGSDDPESIEKAAKLRSEIAKLEAESSNDIYQAQTRILEVIQEQNHSLQAAKELAQALTAWGQIDLGSFEQTIVAEAVQLPQQIASSLVDSIFDRPKRGQSKGQEVLQGLENTGKQAAKQLLTQLLTQGIEKLTAQILGQGTIAAAQATALGANTTAAAALTAPLSANAAATSVLAGSNVALIAAITHLAAVQEACCACECKEGAGGGGIAGVLGSLFGGGGDGGGGGLTEAVTSSISFAAFAGGGTTPANTPYWVGEKGPELRFDSRPGYIMPNHDSVRNYSPSPRSVSSSRTISNGGHTFIVHMHGVNNVDDMMRQIETRAKQSGPMFSPYNGG